MSELLKSRGAQYPLVAEFKFNFDDTMVDTAGVERDFGLTTITTLYSFDVIGMPPGSVVIGGEFVRETAFDTAGYTVEIGDSVDRDRYLASADLKAAGRTTLLFTGFRNVDALPIRFTFTNVDVCTTGVATIRVLYTVADKVNEVAGS